ncbi:2-isopropylmalate synthase [Clostridium gasigenes]|uniref:LeuA family protein n=1 Tax=Clostridium gasigenes TaxID=94869 RepID=UPI00162549D5|nr:2-isopropylmalate synthase [Clostridium gasigenes]MBB6625632.1 2-isopropylmalate synthase [Clostridium gasigenes]
MFNDEYYKNKIFLEETTLRDGEQAPKVNYSMDEKIDLALKISGILTEDDTIDAGFPIVSELEIKTIKEICKIVKKNNISVISRMKMGDIDLSYEALKDTKKRKIVLMTPTSPQHRVHKLNMSKEEVLNLTLESIRYSRKYFDQIEVGFEDGTRTEPEFLYTLMEAVIKEGVDTVTVADTLGCMTPIEIGEKFGGIQNNVSNFDKLKYFGIHCHNDMGLALANSLEAVKYGVNKIGCAFNGLGERTGNVATEELLLLFMLKGDIIRNINSDKYAYDKIIECSKLVSKYSGIEIQKTKAVIGDFCYLHESGIHQDGILKNKETYQLFDPKRVGYYGEIFSIGKHSGSNGLKKRLIELGVDIDKINFNKYFIEFKNLFEKYKIITDQQLLELASEYKIRGV